MHGREMFIGKIENLLECGNIPWKNLLPLFKILNGPKVKVAVDATPKETVPLTVKGSIVTGNWSMLKASWNTLLLSDSDHAVLTLGVN